MTSSMHLRSWLLEQPHLVHGLTVMVLTLSLSSDMLILDSFVIYFFLFPLTDNSNSLAMSDDLK